MPARNAVSVIIPTLQPASLDACLEGLRRQSDKGFEVILVENGHREPEVARLASALGRDLEVRHVYLPEPGANRARNAGAELARNPLLAFIDDDCVAAPDWIAAIRAHDEVCDGDALGGGRVHLDFLGHPPGWFRGIFRDSVSELDLGPVTRPIEGREYLVSANMFIARDLLRSFGGFAEGIGIRGKTGPQLGNDEVELTRRLARRGITPLYLAEVTVRHLLPDRRLDPWRIAERRFGQGISDVALALHENPLEDAARIGLSLYHARNNAHWALRVRAEQPCMTAADARVYLENARILQAAYLAGILCGTIQGLEAYNYRNLHHCLPPVADIEQAFQSWERHGERLHCLLDSIIAARVDSGPPDDRRQRTAPSAGRLRP